MLLRFHVFFDDPSLWQPTKIVMQTPTNREKRKCQKNKMVVPVSRKQQRQTSCPHRMVHTRWQKPQTKSRNSESMDRASRRRMRLKKQHAEASSTVRPKDQYATGAHPFTLLCCSVHVVYSPRHPPLSFWYPPANGPTKEGTIWRLMSPAPRSLCLNLRSPVKVK